MRDGQGERNGRFLMVLDIYKYVLVISKMRGFEGIYYIKLRGLKLSPQ